MANYELSKFYEKTVLKPDEKVLKQLKEEALAIENDETKKLYVSLGEMYKESVLRVDETVVNPDLTDIYLNNLDALTDEQKKQLELHPEYKKRLPHKLSLNQKRAIFESMSKEQYLNIQRERLDLENGMINPSDGGSNVDIDFVKWIRYTGKTDSTFIASTMNYILTIKGMGLWTNIITYPLATSQNIIGTTAKGLGNLGNSITNPTVNSLSITPYQYSWTTSGLALSADRNSPTASWNNWQTTGLSNNFTVDMWVTFTGLTGTNTTGFLTNEAYTTNGFRSGIAYNAGAGLSYNFWSGESGGTFYCNTPNNSIQLGNRINITFTYNALTSAANIYMNGALSGTATGRLIAPTSNTVSINGPFNNTYCSAVLESLAFYNTPLNASQIQQMYNLNNSYLPGDQDYAAYIQATGITNPTYQTRIANFITGIKNLGLWEYMVAWPMRQSLNKGSGSTVYSLGGYGTYNGTMNGSAAWTPGGITFTSNSDYIDYGTFNVALSSGGFNVHAMFSGLGVKMNPAGSDSFLFLNDTTNAYYNGAGDMAFGANNGFGFQARNFNGYRIFDTNNFGIRIADYNNGYDIAYSFISDYLLPTLSSNIFQYNGTTTTGVGQQPSSIQPNGNYILRTYGRNNSTNTPYPNSRVSYLLLFAPGIGMTSQTMSAVYTLCQNTLNQGDADVEAYVAATGASDTTISTFVSGIKAQGLWYNMVSWPLISTQNKGFGDTIYSLGGLSGGPFAFNTTRVNGPTWGSTGIAFNGTNQYLQNSVLTNTGSGTLFACGYNSLSAAGNRLASFIGGIEIGTDVNTGYGNGVEAYYTSPPFNGVGRATPSVPSIVGSYFTGTGSFINNVSITRYINSGQALSATIATTYPSTTGFTIGSRGGTQLFWGGIISIAAFFTVPITSVQNAYVYSLYKSTLGSSLNLP